ncbi:MAG: hypothetical protein ACYCQI_02785 [Gammaproteobacteria bacterium]
MDSNNAKNFFFITTYDNISAEIIKALLNNHPNFSCQSDQQTALLPIISSKSIYEYAQTKKEHVFNGNVKSFTAFSFILRKYKDNIHHNMNVINIIMPITLRIKLLLHHWLSLGLSEINLCQILEEELRQQPVIDLLNQYNFFPLFTLILKHIEKIVKTNGSTVSALVSPQARIFYIALALVIALDEMDNRFSKHNIDFENLLQHPEVFFDILNLLSGESISTTAQCREKLTTLISNINQSIVAIKQSGFLPWQESLIKIYSDIELIKQLRINTIQSSFLSLTYSINLQNNIAENQHFDIAKNQLLLKTKNIHYELIFLHIPEQMRNKDIIVPRSVQENITNTNTRFLYDLSFEAVTFGEGNLEDWLTMHHILEEAGVPAHNVYFVCSNYNVKKHYTQFADKHNINYRFNVFGNHYWPLRRVLELIRDKEFQKIKDDLIAVAKNTIENQVLRPYYFMCLNLKTRLIRTALLLFLLQRGYFSKGIITYLGRHNLNPNDKTISEQHDPFFSDFEVEQFFNQLPEGKILLQYWHQLEEMTPIVYDVNENDTFFADWPLKQLIPELGKYGKVDHFESYFELVTETYFLNETTLNLTEKTIKPILRFQMFIILGSPHTLAELRKLGFQTFSPYIDETYDTIIDPVQRFICIMKEIDRLCNLTIEELHTLYCALWPRILHNYTRITDDAHELLNSETNKLLQELV